MGPGERLSVLSQDHNKFDAETVLDTVLQGHTVLWDVARQRDALYAKEDFTDEDGLLVAELEEKFANLGGYTAENDAAALLSGLGIKEPLHQKRMGELSGKEKVRVMLAQALFGEPDNLLLDEPTNDLDVETLGSLENALLEFPGCAVVISHDRWFLDRVATHILAWEGTEENPASWYWFEGNFESYEQNKIERLGPDAARPSRVTHRKLTRG